MKCFQNRHAEAYARLARQLKTLGAMIVVFLMISALSLPAAHAQDPPDYQLTWLDKDNTIWPPEWLPITVPDEEPRVWARELNEANVVVGRAVHFSDGSSRACMYVHATGRMYDLNHLDNVKWIDLDDQGDETGQWFTDHAMGINEDGKIVGHAYHIDGNEVDRLFVLNNPLGPNPKFELLPTLNGSGSTYYNCCINDAGVVAGVSDGNLVVFDPNATPRYSPIEIPGGAGSPTEINNFGVIVSRISGTGDPSQDGGYVISPAGINPDGSYDYTAAIVDYFPGDGFNGINDSGMISGSRNAITNGPPSQRQDGGPIRLDYSNPENPVIVLLVVHNGNISSGGSDVNNFGDVASSANGRGFISMDRGNDPPETISLDQLVVNQDTQWITLPSIRPRGINDGGTIVGLASTVGFILTPVTNDPTPGITVTPTSGLETTESGGSDSFEIVLNTQPVDDVSIDVSSSDTSEGTVDVTSLTFTSANWGTPQSVTVTGVDDAIADGDVAYTIETTTASSTDLDYNGLDADDVGVTNLDNEQAPSITYDSTENNVPINDQSTAISSILVTDNFTITDLNVTLNIDHARVQDLDVFLISDDGTRIELFTDVGGNGQDFTNTTLDDEAATSITSGSAPFNGSYQPEGNLGGFDGKSTIGLWTLEVTDDKRKKTGTIFNWSFTVEY